ncbi:MAG: 5-(carboxyamino)imidazole ribonucleotide synthase [Polyangiaceae bacterium]|nr:5-(carboxyamino)imidazole ribonucleotide synthase [Polyangiaceae bacterium]
MSQQLTIGILGGGQLGRMLALAGVPLGLRFICVDPASNVPAAMAAHHVQAEYDSVESMEALSQADVVTYEFENVPAHAAAELLRRNVAVAPDPQALVVAQDRWLEKQCFQQLGIRTVGYVRIDSATDLASALAELGAPYVLKTRRSGYDGKGQRVVSSLAEAELAYAELGGVPMIAEEFIRFSRELSILAVQGRNGQRAFYPLVQNEHRHGILRTTLSPAPNCSASLQSQAEGYATSLLSHLKYSGVLALELFDKDGTLYANEFAPRVHNSGHFSIEGSVTSQFENHLRAILGLPLGDTAPRSVSAMLNLIGDVCKASDVLGVPDAHLHTYGKSARKARKVGHITVLAPDPASLSTRVVALQRWVDLATDG